ncbi:hypothetical protein ACFYRC_36845 [Streptomyces sp. NPDC005279]|uniref:hypothetical protein n=1 Tax=Streptomyces sp. NPDC005279 TaxID=3364712 RepID=UPI0036AD993B
MPKTTISDLLNGKFVEAPPFENVAALAAACVRLAPCGEDGRPEPDVLLKGDAKWWRRRHGELIEELAESREVHRRSTTRARLVDGGGPIIDIGSIEPPNMGSDAAEIRFSVSNYGSAPFKVTSIALNVLERRDSPSIQTKVPLGPIDEYFLFADIANDASSVELLERHHIVDPSRTDGFFLKIDGAEGVEVDLRLVVTWNHLGDGECQSELSQAFTIDFPAHSPRALLESLRRRRHEE